jgi:ribosomal protein L19E
VGTLASTPPIHLHDSVVDILRVIILTFIYNDIKDGIKEDVYEGTPSAMEDARNAYDMLFWLKSQKGRSFSRPKRRWEDYIKMDHEDVWRMWTRCVSRPIRRYKDNSKMDFKCVGQMRTRFVRLKVGTSGCFL